jgi:hypothetical protein
VYRGCHHHETHFTPLFINTLPQHQKCSHDSLFNVYKTPTETGLRPLCSSSTHANPYTVSSNKVHLHKQKPVTNKRERRKTTSKQRCVPARVLKTATVVVFKTGKTGLVYRGFRAVYRVGWFSRFGFIKNRSVTPTEPQR